MSEYKHTPGPLVASNENALRSWCIYRQTRRGIDSQSLGEANCKEDAILWAAAPELLEACKALLEAYAPRAQETVDARGEAFLHSSVQSARAAIAAATRQ